MEYIDAPQNCEDCSTSCPLKIAGCMYDLIGEALEFMDKLEAAGIAVNMERAVQEMTVKARECRRNIVAEAETHNVKVRLAMDVAQILRGEAPQNGNGKRRDGASKKAEAVAVEAGPSERRAPTGDGEEAGGYLTEADRATEMRIRAAGASDVHGFCVHPRVSIEKVDDLRRQWEERFSAAPFKGLVGIVRKRHQNSDRVCSVTAYYRGPPIKEARELLRERRELQNSA